MNLKKYLTLTRMGVMESLQFRLSMLVIFAGNLLYLVVVYFLWKAIYASSGEEVVNGMTFHDTWRCTRYGRWAGRYSQAR